MGMYTGLKCKVKIKEEYREDIQSVMDSTEWYLCKHKELKDFSKVSRSLMIPFGASCYMPDEWEDNNFDFYFNDDGIWNFQCALKNYDSTIEIFIKLLELIASEVYHLETFYEEDEYSHLYEMKDGKIIDTGKGIKYL